MRENPRRYPIRNMAFENVGYLGLGIMGYPMALNLVKAGKNVTVWTKDTEKASRFAKETGARKAETPKAVAQAVDLLFVCVGDTWMAEEILLRKDSVLDSGKRGLIVADISSISPDSSREIGAQLKQKGIQYLDAPCTGSKVGAENGTLTFMVGGDQAVFEQTKPIFQLIGKQFHYCGELGLGMHAKLALNLVQADIMQAFNEGMVLAAKGGVDPQTMLDILNDSGAKCGVVSGKGAKVIQRDFTTNFSTKWMLKDITLALESAKKLAVGLPMTAVNQQMFQATMARGDADADFGSIIKATEALANFEVKVDGNRKK
jgi:3-hydroxyisobutyrate dehydrogenase-like beta-hydroxyacid dehydrogenase